MADEPQESTTEAIDPAARYWRPALALLFLGLLQMTGDLMKVPAVAGLAAASGASPKPKVFSAVNGLETYSTHFTLEWQDKKDDRQYLVLTPEVNAGIRGPYNRRNIYGAVLAYGPVLAASTHTQKMFAQVTAYAFCGDAPLMEELGIDRDDVAGPITIRLKPLHTNKLPPDFKLSFSVGCADGN